MAIFTKQTILKAFFLFVLTISTSALFAQKTFDGSSSNNWNTAANWTPSGVPASTDDVIIPNNFAVVLNVTGTTVKSLTIGAGANASSLTFNSGMTLTVTNAVLINAGTGTGDHKTIAVGTGTLTCGSISINASGNTNRENRITVSTGTLQINGNAVLTGATVQSAITFTGAGTLKSKGAITGAGNLTLPAGSNVELNGTTAQVMPFATTGFNGTYPNLTINNSGGVSVGAATSVTNNLVLTAGQLNVGSGITLTLNGNATRTTGTLTSATTGTINYNNGSAGQTIVSGTYGNLTFNNFNKVLPSTGTIDIAGTFTPGTATGHTITGSTVNFSGAAGQVIPAMSYNNLSSANNARTLASAGTISIAGTFSPGTGVYTTTNSSVNFNGSGSQTIPVITGDWFNLSTSTSGTKSVSGTFNVNGTLNVGAGTTFSANAAVITFPNGPNPFVVAGTFLHGTSTLLFTGSSTQNIPAGVIYYSLTLNGSGNKNITAGSNVDFRVNRNLEISCPVTWTNVNSIYIFKEFNGNMPLNPGAIPVTVGDDWYNTAVGYTMTGDMLYTAEDGNIVNIGGINYKNLTINPIEGNTVTTVIANPITIAGTLTVYDKVTLSSNNNITLLSGPASFANIAPLTGSASITGNVKVQTWFTGGAGKRGTRMVAPTIVETALAPGNKFYQQLKNNMIITGAGGVSNGFDAGNTTQPYAVTLTKYNESATLATSQFTQVGSLSSGILPGEGFFLFYRGDRTGYDPGNPSASAALWSDYVPESFASVVNGPVAQGTVNVPISNSNNPGDTNNGYNVVGNPYVATIDWEKVYASNAADIANEIRIIQPGGAVMSRKVVDMVVSVVNGGDNLGSQYIQPGQGFYIRKTSAGAGTLTFNEAHKEVSGSPERLLKGSGQRDALQLKMSANPGLMSAAPDYYQMYIELSDGVNRDETAIVFKEGFDANFDEIDAPYLSGSTVILSSFSADGKANAINYMPALAEVREVKLNVNAAASGVLTLNFSNISSFSGFRVTLQDNYLNTQTDVKANPVYSFSIDRSVAASFGGNRFVLMFEGVVPLQLNLSGFTAVQQHTGVLLNWSTANEQSSVRIEIERSAGNTTFTKIGEKAGAGTTATATNYSFTDTAPLNGLNYYRLKQVYADGTFSYSEIKAVSYNKPGATPPKISFRLYPNPADNVIHIDVTGIRSKLIIYDLFGRIVKAASYENGEPIKMDISTLRPGVYFAELKDLTTNKPSDIIIFFKK